MMAVKGKRVVDMRDAEWVREARRLVGEARGQPISRENFAHLLRPKFTASLITKVELGKAALSPSLAAAVTKLLLTEQAAAAQRVSAGTPPAA